MPTEKNARPESYWFWLTNPSRLLHSGSQRKFHGVSPAQNTSDIQLSTGNSGQIEKASRYRKKLFPSVRDIDQCAGEALIRGNFILQNWHVLWLSFDSLSMLFLSAAFGSRLNDGIGRWLSQVGARNHVVSRGILFAGVSLESVLRRVCCGRKQSHSCNWEWWKLKYISVNDYFWCTQKSEQGNLEYTFPENQVLKKTLKFYLIPEQTAFTYFCQPSQGCM